MEGWNSFKVNAPKLLFTILFPKSVDIARNNFLWKMSSFGRAIPNFGQNAAFLFGIEHPCGLGISSISWYYSSDK